MTENRADLPSLEVKRYESEAGPRLQMRRPIRAIVCQADIEQQLRFSCQTQEIRLNELI